MTVLTRMFRAWSRRFSVKVACLSGFTLALFVSPARATLSMHTPVGHLRTTSKTIPLVHDPGHFTLELREELNRKQLHALLKRVFDPGVFSLRLHARKRGHAWVEFFGSGADLSRKLTQLQRHEEIEWVLPGLRTTTGTELGLSDEMIVSTHGPCTTSSILEVLGDFGAEIQLKSPWSGGCLVKIHAPSRDEIFALSRSLESLPEVLAATPNTFRVKQARLWMNDPFFPDQWQLHNTGQGGVEDMDMDVLEAWDYTTGNPKVIIAVVDDGFDTLHPELIANNKIAPGEWDFWDGDSDAYAAPVDVHGTPVAGISVAQANNGLGIAGICPECRWIPIRQGYMEFDHIQALARAGNYGAHVINNSWGYFEPGYAMHQAVQEVRTQGRSGKGTMIVFAAGNDDENVDEVEDISFIDGIITVSATDGWGLITGYSNYGPSVDLCAPVDGYWSVYSTDITGYEGYDYEDYTLFGGTSAAAPEVSGVIGLVFSVNPELTEAQAVEIILSTAIKVDEGYDNEGHSDYYGYGMINALAAVSLASGVVPQPAINPEPAPDPDPDPDPEPEPEPDPDPDPEPEPEPDPDPDPEPETPPFVSTLPLGAACATASDCASGFCRFGFCSAQCLVGGTPCEAEFQSCQRATLTGDPKGFCIQRGNQAPGATCASDAECSHRFCATVPDGRKLCLLPCDFLPQGCPTSMECASMFYGSAIGTCVWDEGPEPGSPSMLDEGAGGCAIEGPVTLHSFPHKLWILLLLGLPFARRRFASQPTLARGGIDHPGADEEVQ